MLKWIQKPTLKLGPPGQPGIQGLTGLEGRKGEKGQKGSSCLLGIKGERLLSGPKG